MSRPSLPHHFVTQEEQARRLLAIVLARQVPQVISRVTVGKVLLSSEQVSAGIKSRLVGKEGRNIRAFEDASGCELLVNDEPQAIGVSCFDPFRREVARAALETLIRDGRIHPPAIEQALAQACTDTQARMVAMGFDAIRALGLPEDSFDPAVVSLLGTLGVRESFTQNQLDHSVETGAIAGALAAELGFDPQLAKRAGLLHDLGKAMSLEQEGTHAQAGAEFARIHGEDPRVVRAIEAHHEEATPPSGPEHWLDHLVVAADAASGARPGARPMSTQVVLQRAKDLEKMALGTPGVREAYAIRGARELRVFVDAALASDAETTALADRLRQRIGTELRFPGLIQVTVIRELRVSRDAGGGKESK